MEVASERATVERVVRTALDEPQARLLDFRRVDIEYDAYLPGRRVSRFVGTAAVGGVVRPFSVVRKWTDSLAATPAAPWERGRREALAYRSGLLTAPSALRAPRPMLIEVHDSGPVDLWLEDVPDPEPGRWSMSAFEAAARALGSFNAGWLDRALPPFDWLVVDWARRQSEPLDVPAAHARISADAASPRARALLGADSGGRARRMLDDQPGLIRLLEGLPQVLCHHDAARSNLVVRPGLDGSTEIVALDWESAGPGPLGADVATLVSGSVRKGDAAAELLDELDRVVFTGYLEGLRSAGWTGDPDAIRLGYAGSLALRSWFVRDTLRNLADPAARPSLGRAAGTEPTAVLAAFARIARFLLDRADEARALAPAQGLRVS